MAREWEIADRRERAEEARAQREGKEDRARRGSTGFFESAQHWNELIDAFSRFPVFCVHSLAPVGVGRGLQLVDLGPVLRRVEEVERPAV